MHTVFINTTKNKIDGRIDLLKTEKDLKKLMYVDCPLENWFDEKCGYKEVTRGIAQLIDTYNDINNDYNLIIYVDLVEFFEVMKLSADDRENPLLPDCCKAVLSNLITSTILARLESEGRSPSNSGTVLLLERPEAHAGIPPNKEQYMVKQIEAMMALFHLCPMSDLITVLALGSTEVKISDITVSGYNDLKVDLCKLYEDKLQPMIKDAAEVGVQKACEDFCSVNMDVRGGPFISEFYTDKRKLENNLEIYTKHIFLLQCFIFDCVKSEKVHDEKNEVKKLPALSDVDWDAVEKMLYQKKKKYEIEHRKIEMMNLDFTELGLAPQLYKLAKEKFGLDESGQIRKEYKEKPVQTFDRKSDNSKTEALDRKLSEVVVDKGEVQNWFKEEYKLYKTAEGIDSELRSRAKKNDKRDSDSESKTKKGDKHEFASRGKTRKVDEYRKKALQLANYHLNLYSGVDAHVRRVMANYSGYSISNSPPLLRKRRVNSVQFVDDQEKNDYKYAERSGGNKRTKETEMTEAVVENAKRAYVSVMTECMSVNADRGVAMIDFRDQCEWFINRILKIEESLKKLFLVFISLCVTLLAVYLPFILIQWNHITKNIGTIVAAALSLAVPYFLLFVFYIIGCVLQRQKIDRAWDELVKRSDEACAENEKAIKSYDRLMANNIPALRWIYEYVLDVKFHCDCCEIARAKLSHHKEKLYEFIEAIGNFLEDLDWIENPSDRIENFEPPEYRCAFCEGDKNRAFYSVIDDDMLDVIRKNKRKD